MMPRKVILPSILLGGLLLLLPGNALAVEEILDWHSDIRISTDGSMTVTETIRVRAEARQIKRGIYRDFPTTYKDSYGNRIVIGFDVLSVKRDGKQESFHTEDQRNGVRIYIGQKAVYLKPGEYTYEITYRTDRQLGFFKNHDELYWNVTGNGWDFNILKATATVSLPEPFPPNVLRAEGYVGPFGSREKGVDWHFPGSGRAHYESRRPLGPREGMTIVFGWPKGVVAEPGKGERARRLVTDNAQPFLVLGGILIVCLYYFVVWNKVGRDPDSGTIIPRFTPPDNLSPAAMRYIMEMSFDNRAFASAVIDLAVKGYLNIEDDTKALGLIRTYTLRRTGEEPKDPLSSGEQKAARKLFPGNLKSLTLEKKNHRKIRDAIDALKKSLEGEYQKAHFATNSGHFGIGFLLSIVLLVLVGMTGGSAPGGPPFIFVLLWLAPWTAGTLGLWYMRKFLMAAVFTFFLVMATVAFAQATSPLFIGAIFLVVFLNILFFNLLKAPTRMGRRVMDKVEGFKMYLSTAEEHRLEKLHPPEKTPDLFEKYLPYALALEVDQQWSEKFAGVLYRAATQEDYSPRWYHGHHWDSMDTGRFSSSLASSFSSAISSSSQAPGSSSGFGGGGSGGGGGGGGGGGW